jgi:hypothetical protein
LFGGEVGLDDFAAVNEEEDSSSPASSGVVNVLACFLSDVTDADSDTGIGSTTCISMVPKETRLLLLLLLRALGGLFFSSWVLLSFCSAIV